MQINVKNFPEIPKTSDERKIQNYQKLGKKSF